MAKDKNSFIMYADQIELFEELSDKDAGELIKHILRYVNDMNPETTNPMVKISFIPIKQSLKRDLKRFEGIIEKRSLAGQKSAQIRALKKATHVESVPTNPTHVDFVKKISTNPTDSVSVSVSDSDSDSVNDIINKKHIEKKSVFNFRKSLLNLGIEKTLVEDFLKNRKLKKLANTQTAFKNLKTEFEKNGNEINQIFEMVVSNGWGSFKNSWSNKSPKSTQDKNEYDLKKESESFGIVNPNNKNNS